MFTLSISHPGRSSVSTHPGRDFAHTELVTFGDKMAQRVRVVAATWTHAAYEIVDDDDNIVGRASIDELCACTHREVDHDETGCTAITFDPGPLAQCRCPGHRPICADPPLFVLQAPT